MSTNNSPTTFTDEDLRILKETRQYWEARTQSPPELLSCLLVRLEAAENVIKLTAIDMEHFKKTSKLYLYPTLEAIEVWRKTAGKVNVS